MAEVTHSAFYAPQYVAIEKGYFKELGLDVSLLLTNGADKTMSALLSGDAQIGLMGPEASIYVYNGGQENYAINFLQLTKKDGSFIVSRKNINNFTLDDLKNKEILGGRKGGVPEMTLEYILKKHGFDVGRDDNTKDVNVRTDIQFQAMAGAFASGTGDFVTLFEPTASKLEKENNYYVVASLGELSGELPYTCYSSLKKYMEKNEDILLDFTKAIYKAQIFVKNNSSLEIAKVIHKHFLDLTLEELKNVIDKYKKIDAYSQTPYLKEEDFNKLMEIMELAGELDKKAPFSKIVNLKFANEVI